MTARHPPIETLLGAYLDADYRWELDGDWHRMRIGSTAPQVDLAFPEATRFGLVSAWNPFSVERPEHENRAADDALHFQLADSHLAYRPAFSSGWDRSWREPSWLVVGMPVQTFDTLARRFGQMGTLWWRRGEPVRLRMYAPRPLDHPGHPHVDWVE